MGKRPIGLAADARLLTYPPARGTWRVQVKMTPVPFWNPIKHYCSAKSWDRIRDWIPIVLPSVLSYIRPRPPPRFIRTVLEAHFSWGFVFAS
jgi:hypothetical protein